MKVRVFDVCYVYLCIVLLSRHCHRQEPHVQFQTINNDNNKHMLNLMRRLEDDNKI